MTTPDTRPCGQQTDIVGESRVRNGRYSLQCQTVCDEPYCPYPRDADNVIDRQTVGVFDPSNSKLRRYLTKASTKKFIGDSRAATCKAERNGRTFTPPLNP